jgi:penicillin-binding protein 2
MGVDRISTFMGPFGYGSATGIDITGEKGGILPSRDWKAKTFKRPADQIWFPGETVNMGVGQGYLAVTPIQQAHYAGIMAMRGKRFRPRLVTAWRDGTGKVHPMAPIDEGDIKGVAPENWERVRKDMIGVVNQPGGTAYGVSLQVCDTAALHALNCVPNKIQYTAAGKTGTAQVYTVQQDEKYKGKDNEALRDHAWFIAFAPAENPRIAVAVLVEHGGSGASGAAPIARKVMDAYLLGPDNKLKPGFGIDENADAANHPSAGTPATAPPPPKQADVPVPKPQTASTGTQAAAAAQLASQRD